MSFIRQARNEFLGCPSAAEFEELGVVYIMKLFLDVAVDKVLQVFAVISSGLSVFF